MRKLLAGCAHKKKKEGARRNVPPLEALRQAAKVATPDGSPYGEPDRAPTLA